MLSFGAAPASSCGKGNSSTLPDYLPEEDNDEVISDKVRRKCRKLNAIYQRKAGIYQAVSGLQSAVPPAVVFQCIKAVLLQSFGVVVLVLSPHHPHPPFLTVYIMGAWTTVIITANFVGSDFFLFRQLQRLERTRKMEAGFPVCQAYLARHCIGKQLEMFVHS